MIEREKREREQREREQREREQREQSRAERDNIGMNNGRGCRGTNRKSGQLVVVAEAAD